MKNTPIIFYIVGYAFGGLQCGCSAVTMQNDDFTTRKSVLVDVLINVVSFKYENDSSNVL